MLKVQQQLLLHMSVFFSLWYEIIFLCFVGSRRNDTQPDCMQTSEVNVLTEVDLIIV
jgi:hypothetical protein